MAKHDFDSDFDFEKEFGINPDELLDSDYDADIDFSEFTEELDEAQPSASEGEDDSDLDLDLDGLDLGELDLDELGLGDLNLDEEQSVTDGLELGDDPGLGDDLDFSLDLPLDSYPETEEYTEPESNDKLPEDDGPEFIPGAQKRTHSEPEETYTDPDFDDPDFGDEDFERSVHGESETPAEDVPEPDGEEPKEAEPELPEPEEPVIKRPERRERKPARPKPERPKREKKERTGPTLMSKFLDYYMAPLREAEKPQDPNNPRRRRRPSKSRIFKEVYLPPIIVGVTLILIVMFVAGAISNSVERSKQEKDTQLRESQAASEAASRQEQEIAALLEEADRLAQGYAYQEAVDKLNTYSGETNQQIEVKKAEYVNAQSKLVEWKDYTSIPNLSFHVLIADPARAFADKELGGQYNKNFVTIDEFSKVLEQLYAGGYVLVDFDSFTETNTGVDGKANFFTKPIALPEGKKPVMITETMVNYFSYMVDSNKDNEPDAGGAGFAYRLVVDSNGDIRAQMVDSAGQTQTGNFDLVPILEDFIKAHPDFSYQGARAILAVTGSEGIFGYRINTANISTYGQAYYDDQVASAKTLVQALRDKGYTLACFTYGNIAYGDKSATQIKADLQDWANQITPVIGQVDVLVYARTSDIGDYSGAKFGVLAEAGFRYFIKHGSAPAAEVNNTYVKQTRLMVTGENMVWHSDQFSKLFDCAAILNNQRGNVPKS